MRVAQGLYEKGLITYMRTDSTLLSQEALESARTAVKDLYGDEFLSPSPRQFANKSRNAQEAHEAIRPAGNAMKTKDSLGLSGSEGALYDLIWKRTVATQMADARLKFVTARIEVLGDGEVALFRATGRTTLFPGFFRAYVEGSDDPEAVLEDREQPLPELFAGDELACNGVIVAILMLSYYRILGLVALSSLLISGALLWAIISHLGTQEGLALTLAGITGIIVSIGVSVDSNIVYFEHLKEDVLDGRTARSSVDRAFPIAFSTIVKADVASLIGAVLLWWLTVGAVKGFAFYLGLATLLDLVATYFFMGPIVKVMARTNWFANHPKRFGLPAIGSITEARNRTNPTQVETV